jgi:hypothetical protein
MYQVFVALTTPDRTDSPPLPHPDLILSDEWAQWAINRFGGDTLVAPPIATLSLIALNDVKNDTIAFDGPVVADLIVFLETLGQWLYEIAWQVQEVV